MTIARLPLANELKEFDFEAAHVNETLIRDLATGDFLDHQRNLVLIGGTGTGKTHLAVSIARTCIRAGRRGRFFNGVDLVNELDAEARAERQGRTADLISRLDFLILDELGYLHAWETGSEAKAGVGKWIAFYNRKRPHSALGGKPPAVVFWLRGEETQPDQQGQRVA